MWTKTETDHVINIEPRGEEGMHIVDAGCACGPRVNGSDDKRTMIVHKTFNGMEGFVPVEPEVVSAISNRRAA